MAKTDYSKVERLLIEAIRRLKTDQLLSLADAQMKRSRSNVSPSNPELAPHMKILKKVVRQIKEDLKVIKKKDSSTYSELNSERKEMNDLLQQIKNFKVKDWQSLLEIKEKVHGTRVAVEHGGEDQYNEKSIELELGRLEEQGKFLFNSRKDWKSV